MQRTDGARDGATTLDPWLDQILLGDAATALRRLPDASIGLIITSPPYWTAVGYATATPQSSGSYEAYLRALSPVWRECARLLRPNGKIAINAPILPIPKRIIAAQHTRHLKNINNDIEADLLRSTDLQRLSLFIWQKQTSKLMFGSYPYPGNLLENNTIEFINVFVKPGRPERRPAAVKAANRLSRTEWLDLTQQVWFIYPEDVKRARTHPAPFPEKLPARLIRLYSFGAADGHPGDVVLDPFCGAGTTCAAAKRMGRRFIGIDISESYVEAARRRVAATEPGPSPLLVGRPRYPGKADLQAPGTAARGEQAAAKHKRASYGRRSESRPHAEPVEG